jgi:anti-repressor protein
MNELIKVTYENDRLTVSGRDLHKKLGISTRYNDWFSRVCEYGFTENEDYIAITQKRVTAQGNETTFTDHQLTIEMAKQICMIQRTEVGKQYREYFLEVEKAWNSPEVIMARALQVANRQLDSIKGQLTEANKQLEEAKPKVLFADAVATAKTSILIGDLAKLLRQNRLFERLRNDGYLIYKRGASYNLPTQSSMERGLFEIKESTGINPDGSVRVNKTTKVTGKGQLYFVNVFLAEKDESDNE